MLNVVEMSLRQTPRLLRNAAVSIALIVTCLGFSACGSGGGDGNKAVATVGPAEISQATLRHWMVVTLGDDYQPFGGRFPTGLFSDPPDFNRCVSAAAEIPTNTASEVKPKLTTAQLHVKCQQLYSAIKEQTLNFLLSSLSAREEAKELGVRTPSEGEISDQLKALIVNDFKNPAHFNEVLAEERRSIADVRYMIKTSLLQAAIATQLQAHAAQLGNGGLAAQFKLITQQNATWRAKTVCKPGYRASQCRQYNGGEIQPGATTVIERFEKRAE